MKRLTKEELQEIKEKSKAKPLPRKSITANLFGRMQ
jgi:hypothetical protein